MRRLVSIALFTLCLPASFAASPEPAPDRDPAGRQIAVYAAGHETALRAEKAEIWDRGESYVVTGVERAALDRLDAGFITPLFSAPDRGEGIYILSHVESFVPRQIPGISRFVIDAASVLYLVPAGIQMDMPNLKFRAMLHGVPRIALPPIKPHAADLAGPAAPLAPNPLVQQILNATSQASWYNFVREVSGDVAVDIPGTTPACTVAGNCRVLTRYSNAMFPTPNANGKAFATEYLLNRGAGWGYTGTLESFTATESGCTGQPTWKNVIFTIPGQVDWGQHQQVLFITHYDTVSYNATENQNYAPGADDAMSGGSALLEAMKVFKDYAFSNTLKIIYFSGEELITGMCGSYAYTRMHPPADMWRVVNMDQTAYDGNKDKIMNLFNWDNANCPSCVAFGDVYVLANTDYGAPIGAGKLVRQTFKMCQTDHCPFWDVGVTAIDLNENFNEIHPCFDSGQTATCHDNLTDMDPAHPTQTLFDATYSWPTEKIAIATIATVAVPLYACPAAGATLTATAQSTQATLSWGAVSPVTNYLIERAPGGCAGAFAGVGSVPGTGFIDTGLTNNTTYGYRIRTCPTQVSNCIALTPQACFAPGAPAIGTATVPAGNQVSVSWTDGAPASAKFNVYRATGTCAAPGPYVRIASGVAGSPYLDTTVSGGTTYAYRVAGTDASGLCESPNTACVEALATGACVLAPSFAGATTASNGALSTCTATVNWTAGSKTCPAASATLTYKIYRSTVSGSLGAAIATGVTGTSFIDNTGISNGVTYYYTVHAVDSLGNEDANAVQVSTAPTGPSSLGTWTDNAGDTGIAKLTLNTPWTVAATGGSTAPKVYKTGTYTSNMCAAVVTPPLTLGTSAVLSFRSHYATETSWDKGLVQVSTDGGTLWTTVPVNYPATSTNSGDACGFGPVASFTGTVAAYTTYTGSLATWNNQAVMIRWSLSSDTTITAAGWWVDDISITNVNTSGVCTSGCAVTPMTGAVLQTKSGNNLVENWTSVAGAATYTVYRNPSTNVTTWVGPGVATGLAGLTWTDTNQLGNATSQFYSVTAVNSCGAESPK